MTILYAPSFREDFDLLHANCLCTYDMQVLEILFALNKKRGGIIDSFTCLTQKLLQDTTRLF
ncbi:hypothetical protein [Helicobacter turcicus]|uniref:hypothetical protein n=1 Tax=Helicobacter turcicus TaxID=2867412 RepID=UPI001C87E7B5|nr:hypothetical protein [Helicobacter turcicus]MBX7545402.1 hypothetical protein [Helicobacter turcicus]